MLIFDLDLQLRVREPRREHPAENSVDLPNCENPNSVDFLRRNQRGNSVDELEEFPPRTP